MVELNSTVADGTTKTRAAGFQPVVFQPVTKGSTLLDTYRVENDAIEGGMGKVWRVRHALWNADLAMKQPRAELFRNDAQKENFLRECEAWIELGLHPHIVSCYYVRDINGIPAIFSEWMEGGSLKDAIEDGRLYKGNPEDIRRRILDIAIQYARGLGFAHERGMVHQDVKPANLLLDGRWIAKAADFGIAKVMGVLANYSITEDTGGTVMVKGGAYTPAYASPEQLDPANRNLSRRTDIWSWAVTALEMYLGSRPWANGAVAGYACDTYFSDTKIPVPEGMKELLRRCFKEDEKERPHDFEIVEKELVTIYRDEFQQPYPRPVPSAADLSAGSLNNRALSFLDIGKPEEAEKNWKEALEKDPSSSAVWYNQSVYLWEKNEIDDAEARRRIAQHGSETPEYYYYLGKLHAACLDANSAIACYKKAIGAFGETEELKQALAEAEKIKAGGDTAGIALSLEGNANGIDAVCFSPDGKRALAASSELLSKTDNANIVKLFDLETGRCIHTLRGHTDAVKAVGFALNGKLGISGSFDHTIMLWNLEKGLCSGIFDGHTGAVMSVRVSPNGKRILSADFRGIIKLWDIETGSCLRTIMAHEGPVYSVCFSPDGIWGASGSEDKSVKLWDMESGKNNRMFTGHTDSVQSVCFSPDGKLLLSASEDGTIKLWDIAKPLKRENAVIRSFIAYGEKNRVVTEEYSAELVVKNSINAGSPVRSACFSPDGSQILSGAAKNMVVLWDTETCARLRTFEGHIEAVSSVGFSPDGKYALSGSRDRTIRLWSIPRQKIALTMLLSRIQSSEETKEGALRFEALEKEIEILMEAEQIAEALAKLEEIRKLKNFVPAGRFTALVNKIKPYCVLYSVVNQSQKTYPAGTPVDVPVEKKHEVSIYKKNLILQDPGTGNFRTVRVGGYIYHSIKCVSLSPDGKRALTAESDEPTIKLWDVSMGICRFVFEGHRFYINSVCFSPDGKQAVSGSPDNTVKLWDVRQGLEYCLNTFEGHGCDVTSVCFSPNEKLILSGDKKGTVKIWDIAAAACIRTFEEHSAEVKSVSFSVSGDKIVSVSSNETIVWDLEYEMRFPGWQDWDKGARPYLDIFLALYPKWTIKDFNSILLPDLRNRGYGWLKPEGIMAMLEVLSGQT